LPAADKALEEGHGKHLNDSAHRNAPALKDKDHAQTAVAADMPAAEEKRYEMADVDSSMRSVHTSSRTRVLWGIGIAIVGGTISGHSLDSVAPWTRKALEWRKGIYCNLVPWQMWTAFRGRSRNGILWSRGPLQAYLCSHFADPVLVIPSSLFDLFWSIGIAHTKGAPNHLAIPMCVYFGSYHIMQF